MEINKDLLGLNLTPTFLSGDVSISFTAPYDCYAKVTFIDSTWGYDGGTVTVSINATVGSPEVIYSRNGIGNNGNTIARDITAVALYKCKSGESYTFKRGISNGGGEQATIMTAELYPIN